MQPLRAPDPPWHHVRQPRLAGADVPVLSPPRRAQRLAPGAPGCARGGLTVARIARIAWIAWIARVARVARVAKALATHGVALVDVSTGGNVPATIPIGPGYQVPGALR